MKIPDTAIKSKTHFKTPLLFLSITKNHSLAFVSFGRCAFSAYYRRQIKLLQTVAEWFVGWQRSTGPRRQCRRRRQRQGQSKKKKRVAYHAPLSISWLQSTSDSINRSVFTASGISFSLSWKKWGSAALCYSGCVTESRSSGKWLQGVLEGPEPGDFGLVAPWIFLRCYMSPGGYSPTLLLDFACDSRAMDFSTVLILDPFLFCVSVVSLTGILGWKWWTCAYVPGEARLCRL